VLRTPYQEEASTDRKTVKLYCVLCITTVVLFWEYLQ